jgi:hypothetical protein
MDALRPLWDAERPGLHSHAERGNDQAVSDQNHKFPFMQRLTTAAPCSERPHLASSVQVNSGALGRLFLWAQISDQSASER